MPKNFTLSSEILQEKQLLHSAYIPFGRGPRICIGNHFALMEAQLLLATLAQHVAFELAPNQPTEKKRTCNMRYKCDKCDKQQAELSS